MIKFILIFMIPIFSVYIIEKIDKKDFKVKEWIYFYSYFTIIIQLLYAIIFTYIFDGKDVFLLYTRYTNEKTMKCMVILILLSLIVPFITKFVRDNFYLKISISKEKQGKKNEKKNKK